MIKKDSNQGRKSTTKSKRGYNFLLKCKKSWQEIPKKDEDLDVNINTS
jgi:ribosomal protein S26